jgi:ribosomal protein S18 acetylase RimI-like enzyme
MTPFTLQSFDKTHHEWAKALLGGHMATHVMVSRGVLYDPLDYPGFVAMVKGKPGALATYRIDGDGCEILTLHSKVENMGLASALVTQVKHIATEAGCRRLWLITTNDNIHAIRWYQKRGFTIAAVHVNALEQSRKLKYIPPIGFDDIPLRDEIEFEITLN